MFSSVLYGVPIIPIILGLVSAAKSAHFPSAYSPLLSIALGVIFGVGSVYVAANTVSSGTPFTLLLGIEGVMLGLMFGLSASGLYSGYSSVKTAVQMRKVKKVKP